MKREGLFEKGVGQYGGGGGAGRGRQAEGKSIKVWHFSWLQNHQNVSSEGLFAPGFFSFRIQLRRLTSHTLSLPLSLLPLSFAPVLPPCGLTLNSPVKSQPLTAVTRIITERKKWNKPGAALKLSELLPHWLALHQHSFSHENQKKSHSPLLFNSDI